MIRLLHAPEGPWPSKKWAEDAHEGLSIYQWLQRAKPLKFLAFPASMSSGSSKGSTYSLQPFFEDPEDGEDSRRTTALCMLAKYTFPLLCRPNAFNCCMLVEPRDPGACPAGDRVDLGLWEAAMARAIARHVREQILSGSFQYDHFCHANLHDAIRAQLEYTMFFTSGTLVSGVRFVDFASFENRGLWRSTSADIFVTPPPASAGVAALVWAAMHFRMELDNAPGFALGSHCSWQLAMARWEFTPNPEAIQMPVVVDRPCTVGAAMLSADVRVSWLAKQIYVRAVVLNSQKRLGTFLLLTLDKRRSALNRDVLGYIAAYVRSAVMEGARDAIAYFAHPANGGLVE